MIQHQTTKKTLRSLSNKYMAQKLVKQTKTITATSSVKTVAGMTGLLLGASAAIAFILTIFFAGN